MEITECVPTTAEYPVDKIDLTQCVEIPKLHTNNILSENYEMDLTPSSDSDDVPKDSIADVQKSLDETIINNEHLEVINEESKVNEDSTKKVNSLSCPTRYTETSANYYLHEYYSSKKSVKSPKEKHFENTDCSPLSEKQFPIENIDLTQSLNDSRTDNCYKNLAEADVSEIKVNDLMKVTECSSGKQCLIDKIDLTQRFNNSSAETHKENLLTENLEIDLTQTSDKMSLLEEKEARKNNYSLDESVILIDDCNSDSITSREALNDLDLPKDVFSAIIDENCRLLNNSVFNKKSNQIHGKENDINLETHLNQSTNFKNNQVQELEIKKTDIRLDKIDHITEDSESNTNLELNADVAVTRKHSDLVSDDDLKKIEENHDVDAYDDKITDYNYYSYDEHVHNNSDMYDYCIENDLPENNSENMFKDFNNDIGNSPCNKPKHTSDVFDSDTKDIPTGRIDVDEFDNVDLTQSSPEETINQISPKVCKISNLGKVDDISIDYDEMFDDVVSTGSKSATQISFKSATNSKDRNSNNDLSNPSKTSECFEISDKEFNYSVHQSRHNFDIGGLSVLDNISDFEEQSIAKSNRSSKTNLNRSLSDSDLPSASVKRNCTPKAVFNSKNISETSTPVISTCVINEVQTTPSNNDYIIKTHNVTPMLDYESMTSPERNRELEKYGLKPFKRKRAIQLLRHLYEQTHPIVESCDFIDCASPSKRRKYNNDGQQYTSPEKSKRPINSPRNSQKSPRKSQKSPRKLEFNLANGEKENMVYAVSKDTPDIKEIYCSPDDWVFQKREKAKIHSCKVPLHIAFHNYVSCRRLLREAILRYEPINIDVIHKDLVASGYKYNPKDLLRFLDKKCITVKTADNNSRNRKT